VGLRVQADARAALVEEKNLGQVVRTYEPHQRTPSPSAETVMTMGDGQIVGTSGMSHATGSVAAGKGATHVHNQGSHTGASRAGKSHHGIGHAGVASGAGVGKSSHGGATASHVRGGRTPRFGKEDHRTRARALLLVFVLWAAVGCANMTPTQQRALSGGAIGAAGGGSRGRDRGGEPRARSPRSEPLWAGRLVRPSGPSGRTSIRRSSRRHARGAPRAVPAAVLM
jgi:osmotically inducible lipoprotein OsmB